MLFNLCGVSHIQAFQNIVVVLLRQRLFRCMELISCDLRRPQMLHGIHQPIVSVGAAGNSLDCNVGIWS